MKLNKPRFSSVAVGVVVCAMAGSAGAALFGFGPAESWTIKKITSLTTNIVTNITTFGSTFGLNMATKFEQLISAIAVATKQEALSASVVSDNAKDSSEQFVNAVRAQKNSDQVTRTYMDFNPQTGQGFDPCSVLAKNRTLDGAFDGLGATAAAMAASIDVAPGRMVASTGAALAQRLANHRSKFCSQAEADAGLCSVSALPNGDTNAALLFEPAEPNSLKGQAKSAYIQHVLGAPDQSIPKSAGMTPAGQQYMLMKNNKDALQSIPAYSLSMVQAANTQSPEFGGKSPNEVLKLRVNAYFGGKEAQRWSSALTMQSERGLMVEAVKMSGLEVWLHHKQYQQNQRLEMNLAALAMILAQGTKMNIDTKYEKMVHDDAASAIK